jgi:hypothetical protein
MFVRLFMRCRDITPHLLVHALAEASGKSLPNDPETRQFIGFIGELAREYSAVLSPRALLPCPLDGDDLIDEFGLKPSACFKRILKRVEVEHLLRPAFTRKQAIEVVRELLDKKSSACVSDRTFGS